MSSSLNIEKVNDESLTLCSSAEDSDSEEQFRSIQFSIYYASSEDSDTSFEDSDSEKQLTSIHYASLKSQLIKDFLTKTDFLISYWWRKVYSKDSIIGGEKYPKDLIIIISNYSKYVCIFDMYYERRITKETNLRDDIFHIPTMTVNHTTNIVNTKCISNGNSVKIEFLANSPKYCKYGFGIINNAAVNMYDFSPTTREYDSKCIYGKKSKLNFCSYWVDNDKYWNMKGDQYYKYWKKYKYKRSHLNAYIWIKKNVKFKEYRINPKCAVFCKNDVISIELIDNILFWFKNNEIIKSVKILKYFPENSKFYFAIVVSDPTGSHLKIT